MWYPTSNAFTSSGCTTYPQEDVPLDSEDNDAIFPRGTLPCRFRKEVSIYHDSGGSRPDHIDGNMEVNGVDSSPKEGIPWIKMIDYPRF